jgi:hypothetical protein
MIKLGGTVPSAGRNLGKKRSTWFANRFFVNNPGKALKLSVRQSSRPNKTQSIL